MDFIARDLKEQLSEALCKASIQMDGSTDSANVEEELFLTVYFDPHGGEKTQLPLRL